MEIIARVSAVFLLLLGVWVCGALSGETDRPGISARQPAKKNGVGVGTKVAMSGGEVSESAEPGVSAGVKPLTIFREVEKGWRNGTPKPFERYLGKGKVRLDLGEGGPRGGLYTRSQAYYLLTDYLRSARTIGIDFVKVSDRHERGSKPYALLERQCRYRNGLIRKEVVFVALSTEDGRWVIAELRVVPAR